MCEQTEINYLDGEVVWVKLGSCWWPGEVVAPEKLPPAVLTSFRKPPIAIVKFFQENTYEYVKNLNSIYKYNCSRKNEFINKGLYMYRTKHGLMEKFPEDVIRAETAVGGDIEILTRDEFQETKKESYAGLFGDTRSAKKGKGKGRSSEALRTTPMRKMKEKTDYKVHILVQGSATPNAKSSDNPPATPSQNADTELAEPIKEDSEKTSQDNNSQENEKPITPEKRLSTDRPSTSFSTPTISSSGIYSCHACAFSTSRLNVLILHNKTHSVSFMPYTPSPVKKKVVKPVVKYTTASSTPKTTKLRKDKIEKVTKKSVQSVKRTAEDPNTTDSKKQKTDEEIKSSLLADWDDIDEESNDESSSMVTAESPEVPIAAESPAVPTPAELPSAQVPADICSLVEKKTEEPTSEKLGSTSDSKYDFREDEDWPVEADLGRKIPRLKNPKRKGETKSLSLEDEEVAREVAELLNKTTVPELPSVPEPLKVEENFPEPSVVKSPDKQDVSKSPDISQNSENPATEAPPTKAIFKTKTFFRSRHSRSQDAIGKYVAEQLNAVERMDMSESEINGSDTVSSPEARDSPPIENIKVARLAPKIQLKKMKAEAAQLRERERNEMEFAHDDYYPLPVNTTPEKIIEKSCAATRNEFDEGMESTNRLHDEFTSTEECKTFVEVETENNTNVDDSANVFNNELPNEDTDDKICNVDLVVNDLESESVHYQNENKLSSHPKKSSLAENTEVKLEQPYMNESTASAVDALLSVSREADRVTKVISDDPPEDLFEDDNKDKFEDDNKGKSEDDNEVKFEDDNKDNSIINGNAINEPVIDDDDVKSNLLVQTETNNRTEIQESNEVNIHDDLNSEIKTPDVNQEPPVPKCLEDTVKETEHEVSNCEVPSEAILESVPSESDLQIAETLISLPATAMQSQSNELKESITVATSNHAEKKFDTDTVVIETQEVSASIQQYKPREHKVNEIDFSTESSNTAVNENILRFETEQEKSENLNAAQSLVQMSKSIDHKINIIESNSLNNKEVPKSDSFSPKQNNGLDKLNFVEHNVTPLSADISTEIPSNKASKYESTSSKLLKILEEPCTPKASRTTPSKQSIIPGKEKILNFEVAKSSLKSKSPPVIIRRAASNKTIINSFNDIGSSETIILSRGNKTQQDGSSVHTYAIQTAPEVPADANTITIIQQKVRKVQKTPSKLQKIKAQNSLVIPEPKVIKDIPVADDTVFDINSMPIVLSDDSILTPESIEKMPIVMSDGNLITNTSHPPKLVKTKQSVVEAEKPTINIAVNKPELKTLLINPVGEGNKGSTTPNILSKSSKLRGAKPMLVIDKTTGKQKIVMTKSDPSVKELKPAPQPIAQTPAKAEKFIILPTAGPPRPGRTQKIVIDPQTGKPRLVGKDHSANVNDNKPVSAKLIPSSSDASGTGNTVMIITNAQGAQSRIVLTSEHEKILFPNKQQPQQQQNVSQLKTITHRITTNSASAQKSPIPQMKTQTRIVPKQKSAIITSKGQLIVGGRVATTAQNIAPMPEIRPVPKRLVPAEPKKIVQAIQKAPSEPLIFLQQKSGSVVQLTASQFEHFQRTGQIIQKIIPHENKIVQKTITISHGEPSTPSIVQKQRIRKTITESPTPPKRLKQEIAIAPAPPPIAPMPALTPLSNTVVTTLGPSISNTVSVTTSSYSELDNFEEMLPTTAIVRPPEPVVIQPEPAPVPAPQPPAPAPAPLADGQLLAVPGEHFGGPPGSFYLCVEDNGTLTPIDNRPLVLENNQLMPMSVEQAPALAPQPERRDILEAALANSDVFHADPPRDEAPDFRDLNANVSVHCRVSETSTTLNQPIMTPVEVPTKADTEPTVPSNLEDGLAVIGVTPHSVPTSLELPITVTDPRIAPKTTDPLSGNNYGTSLLPSPNTEMTFVTSEEVDSPVGGSLSMPLLTEEDAVGKSMPMLTDEVAERTVSSVDTIGSPSSIDVRESETEDGGQWTRRLLTPGSDTSETSSEIPLQPAIQLSVNDMSHSS